MPFYTAEEIEELKKTSRGRRIDCGWNIPPSLIAKMAIFLENWQPTAKKDIRDKEILRLVFIENMNGAQIIRTNNPLFVSYSNNSKGEPLDCKSIGTIVYKYCPELKNKPKKTNHIRNAVSRDRLAGKINKPKICSACGSKKNLELHHIIPIAKGGNNENYNLIFLCQNCHKEIHRHIYNKLQ